MKNTTGLQKFPHVCTLLTLSFAAIADEPPPSNGLAPEVTALSPKDVSWALEAKLPDLEKPFITASPADMKDGIPVGKLENNDAALQFANEMAAGQHGQIDSLLVARHGTLVFESYYRRGRANYPHFQMSITKSYTAMAIGRAMQLGLLKMEDLDKPVVGFLKNLDRTKLAPGADSITLAQAMNMGSGIRLDEAKVKERLKQPAMLKGQGQIQAYLECSAPIPGPPREFKYQEADPSMTMQVLDAIAPGGARAFITTELFGKMGITNFAWENDVSGLPKAAAGSGVRSRDMVKWGIVVLNKGKWNGEQLIPAEYVERATSPLTHSYAQSYYGYFWWVQDFKAGGKMYHSMQGRGAGGQFIFMVPELDLVVAITSHEKGMGTMLSKFPTRIVPAFSQLGPPSTKITDAP